MKQAERHIQVGPTFILKAAIIVMGLGVLTILGLLLPDAVVPKEIDDYQFILWGLYVSAVPFLYALYAALRLLGDIDHGRAFSLDVARWLLRIKYVALTVAGLYTLGLPHLYKVAQRDDAPGVLAIGLVIIGISVIIAMAAAVFESLVRQAVAIKSENDLTV